MKVLVVIPARGGSKGIPGKNIKLLAGKPLIQYTIEAARQVFRDEQICVSTDDLHIKAIVEGLGLKVPFLRPSELATDEAGTYDVLLHALSYYHERKECRPDTIVLLQVTSPFRMAIHIREAMDVYDENVEMVISVMETKANPYFVLKEENSKGWLVNVKERQFLTRQDCPKVYEVNGAIYIINVKALIERPLSKMTRIRKYQMDHLSSLDIDDLIDWKIAECLVEGINF